MGNILDSKRKAMITIVLTETISVKNVDIYRPFRNFKSEINSVKQNAVAMN